MSRGFYNNEYEKVKREWEIARWQTWYGLQPHVKKGKIKKPSDLVRFAWEKQGVTSEDIKEMKLRGMELSKKWGRTLESVN